MTKENDIKTIILNCIRIFSVMCFVAVSLIWNVEASIYPLLVMLILFGLNNLLLSKSNNTDKDFWFSNLTDFATFCASFVVFSCYAIIPLYVTIIFACVYLLMYIFILLLSNNSVKVKFGIFFNLSYASIGIGLFMYYFVYLFGYFAFGFCLFGIALTMTELIMQIINNRKIIKFILFRK